MGQAAKENENASIVSGDDLVALNIRSLSDHLKFLTTRITQYGRKSLPLVRSHTALGFLGQCRRSDKDRSLDLSLYLEAAYRRAFHRTTPPRFRHKKRSPEKACPIQPDRPDLVSIAPPSGNGTAVTNGRAPKTPAELAPPARAMAAAYQLLREGKPVV